MSGASLTGPRVYFALWPTAPECAELLAATDPVTRAAGGRVLRPEQLHLTLEFLGTVPAAAVEPLKGLGDRLRWPVMSMWLDRLAYWPRARMIVLEPSTPPGALLSMQAELRGLLVEQGFGVDLRPYRPHVTLARGVDRPPAPDASPRVEWVGATLALVESRPEPQGSRYTLLARWAGRVPDADIRSI